ncbi:hypothetical protein [Prosthecomicrobium sp. N25]|uniref:hypothetical protein n=1 Tax=Prosthecomicrobium sp. N25 TaxID=3129254 RepID=UPI0030786D48
MARSPDPKSRPARSPALAPGRLPLIVAGYAAGAVAAGVALPLALIVRDMAALGFAKAIGSARLGDIAVVALFAAAIAAVAAAPFAVAFIAHAERRRITGPVPHLLFGIATGLVVETLAIMLGFGDAQRASLAGFLVFAFVGAVAGLVYWSVAVRPPKPRKPAPRS